MNRLISFYSHYVKRALPVISILCFALAYLATRSLSLDDEDAVHFARALDRFDLETNRPHPPGFPVYVLLARMLHVILPDPVKCLTTLSVMGGVISLFLLYLIIRRRSYPSTALFCVILLGLTPMFWMSSVKALSDMPALVFVLGALFCVDLYADSRRPGLLSTAALISGISTGLRPHGAFLLLPILLAVCRGGKQHIRNILIYLTAGVLLWLLPVLWIEGFPDYFIACANQFGIRMGDPQLSILASSGDGTAQGHTFIDFPYYFALAAMGIDINTILGLFIALGTTGMVILGAWATENNIRWVLLIGLLTYTAMICLALPPTNARYWLVLMPFFTVAFVRGTAKLGRFGVIIYILSVVLLASQTLPLAKSISSAEAPISQACRYIDKNMNPSEVMLQGGRHTQAHLYHYLVPKFQLIPSRAVAKGVLHAWRRNLAVIEVFENPKKNEIPIARFHRDPRIHYKAHNIYLYRKSKPADIKFSGTFKDTSNR